MTMNQITDETRISPTASSSTASNSSNFVSLCDYDLSTTDEEKEEVKIKYYSSILYLVKKISMKSAFFAEPPQS